MTIPTTEDLSVTAKDRTLNNLMGTDSWFIGALGQRVISHETLHVALKADHDLLHTTHESDHRLRWDKHDAAHLQTLGAGEQRWGDHGAVHESDKAALNKALEQADKALLAALEAHRREHLIREEGQARESATHQTQHQALNELRQVVGDLTSQYARIGSIDTLTVNWDRRWDERQKEEAAYRTQVQVEEQNYRGQVRTDIASLRESRSEGTGGNIQRKEFINNSQWSIGIFVILGVALIEFVLKFIKV